MSNVLPVPASIVYFNVNVVRLVQSETDFPMLHHMQKY